MTDTDREYAVVGVHTENLQSGAMISPGDRVKEADLGPDDQWMIDEGRLQIVKPPTKAEKDRVAAGKGDAGKGGEG